MQGNVSTISPAWSAGASWRTRTVGSARPAASRDIRIGLLLVAVLVSSWASLAVVDTPSQVPTIWPAGGIVAGLLLTSPARARPWLTGSSALLILLAYLAHGYDLVPAALYAAGFVAAACVARSLLVRGLEGRRAALRDSGDVSRFVRAITMGSLVAAVGYGLTTWIAGEGNPLLGAVAAFGASAAALMVTLPLFIEAVKFEPIAGPRERMVQAALTLGTTVVLFISSDMPLVVFAVMPMFAWHAFRGTLREATFLLVIVAGIGSVAGVLHTGPVWGVGERYGLPPELTWGILQLFVVDCGIILLPLSVMVTQQRMSAAAADAERETLTRLVESATGTAIISLGLDGLVRLFNPGAEQMLGYAEEEVLGQHTQMFHPRGELRRQAQALGVARTFPDICRAAAESREAHLWRFVRKDGVERVVRMRLNAVLDGSGRLTGYLATAEDFTEREAAQRAMELSLQHQQTAVQRLEELERVKGDFVATVSHELRTPITSIIGYTELLEDGLVGDLSPAQLDVVGRVDRNGRRLLLLVEDLLTLSQIEASSLKIEPVVTDIRCVVDNARRALDTTLADRTLDVVVTTPEEPVVHHGDPVQLERMMVSLMTNAVKFTPDGGTVELTLLSDGERSEIVVKDDGVGMTDEDQGKLFTKFFRSTSSFDQAVQGTGLGLTIVKAIVALHGGGISVASAYGQGTTVSVTIPRVALSATPSAEDVALESATG